MIKSYAEAEKYILNIPKFAAKNTPEDTALLLERITGGKLNSRIIHVAGTNGKGSVCAYLRSILMESGASVGMFISPHLETMRERICLGERQITKQEFLKCFDRVEEILKQQEKHPSFFEFLFLMAMDFFAEKQPDYLILETGLGGRLDATNSVPRKELCILTEIGFDHMQYLGNTLTEIAWEKAGIIKERVPVVLAGDRPAIVQVLLKRAEEKHCLTRIVENRQIDLMNIGNKTIDFSFHSGYYNYVGLSLNTSALYQMENASLAVTAAEIIQKKDKRITKDSIKNGLKRTVWPGRMEEAAEGIFLDGAHNEDGIEAFLHSVREMKNNGRKLLLFGVVADKSYEGMIGQIAKSDLFDRIAVTHLESARSASLDKLREIWSRYDINCSFHEEAKDAYQALLAEKEKQDVIYIAGSLYLIGQMKTLMRRTQDD